MELKSLKKKFKDKRFAAGCSRETIQQGAQMLGWELDYLLEETLKAMQQSEDVLLSLIHILTTWNPAMVAEAGLVPCAESGTRILVRSK